MLHMVAFYLNKMMRIGSEKGWTVLTHSHFCLYIFVLSTVLCFRGLTSVNCRTRYLSIWLSFGCLLHLWFISINCPFAKFSLIKLFDVFFAVMTLTEGTKSPKYYMEALDLLEFPVCDLPCIRRQEAWSQELFSPLKILSYLCFVFC